MFFDADDTLARGGSGSSTPSAVLSGECLAAAQRGPADCCTNGPACAGVVGACRCRDPSLTARAPATRAGPLPSASPAKDLAEFTLKLRQPGSPEYDGVDTSLDVSLRLVGCKRGANGDTCTPAAAPLGWVPLPHPRPPHRAPTPCSALYFYCNRPTVAALITLGLDIGVAAGSSEAPPAAPAATAEAGEGACQVEGEPAAVDAAAATAAAQGGGAAEEPLDQARLLGGGGGDGGDRSMFRLTASLGTLQVLLNYEGSGCHTLSQVGRACCPGPPVPRLARGAPSSRLRSCCITPPLSAIAPALSRRLLWMHSHSPWTSSQTPPCASAPPWATCGPWTSRCQRATHTARPAACAPAATRRW